MKWGQVRHVEDPGESCAAFPPGLKLEPFQAAALKTGDGRNQRTHGPLQTWYVPAGQSSWLVRAAESQKDPAGQGMHSACRKNI